MDGFQNWYPSLYYIPNGIGEFFPNISAIFITGSQLKEIKMKNFKQFPKLTYVNLADNDLEYLPHDLFHHTPKIVFFNAWRNRLVSIGSQIFMNLKSLQTVELEKNFCIDEKFAIPKDSLKLEKLESQLEKFCSFTVCVDKSTVDESIRYVSVSTKTLKAFICSIAKQKEKIEKLEKELASIAEQNEKTEKWEEEVNSRPQTVKDHLLFRLFFGNWD